VPKALLIKLGLTAGLAAMASCALAASAADGRRWIADGDSEIARLIYGTPESDDMLLSLTCEKESKTFWLWFAAQPAPANAADKMPLTVSTETGNVEMTADGTRSDMDDSYSLEVKTTMTPDLAKLLSGAKTVSIKVDNRKTDVTFDDVALGAVPDLVQGCTK
jgi:hypothetical protein